MREDTLIRLTGYVPNKKDSTLFDPVGMFGTVDHIKYSSCHYSK